MPRTIQEELLELAQVLRFFKLYQLSNMVLDISAGLHMEGITTQEHLDHWITPKS